jgi:capsular polysaccharide biosynthesis protein
MQNFTLADILDLVLAKLKWLILGLLCGAVLFSAYTVFFMEEQYTASVSLYVENTEANEEYAVGSNLSAAKMLTNSYVIILRNASTLRAAAENMPTPTTVSQMGRALSIKASEDAAIITISATTNDAILSQSICEAMSKTAPGVILKVVNSGSVKPLGTTPPAVKTGPDLVQNTLLGALAGFVLAAVVVLIAYLSDTTIKGKPDLKRTTDLPVLGEIPTLTV